MLLLFVIFFIVFNTFANAAPIKPTYLSSVSGSQQKKTSWDHSVPSTSFSRGSSSIYNANTQESSLNSNVNHRNQGSSTNQKPFRSLEKVLTSKKPYKCVVKSCSVSCSSPERLEYHKKEFHTTGKKEYKCGKCSQIFSADWRLDKHREQC